MHALVRFHMASPKEANIVARSLSIGKKPGVKSISSAIAENDTVVLAAESEDLGSLRAVLNSSMREVKIANDCLL